jgi:hypothetical protein
MPATSIRAEAPNTMPVGLQRAEDAGELVAGDAVQHRQVGELLELGQLVDADREAVPVDDGIAARLVRDAERTGAQAAESHAAVDHGGSRGVRLELGCVEREAGGNGHRDLLRPEERFGLTAGHVGF